MTRTAFCRKSPRVPRVCWLGSWALGTSDRGGRGGQDKANWRSRTRRPVSGRETFVCTLDFWNRHGWRLTTFHRGRMAHFELDEEFQRAKRWRSRTSIQMVSAFYSISCASLRFSTIDSLTALARVGSDEDRRLMATDQSDDFHVRPGRVGSRGTRINPRGSLRSQPFLKQVQVAVRRAGGDPNRIGRGPAGGEGRGGTRTGRFNARGRGAKLVPLFLRDGDQGGWQRDSNGRFRSRRVAVKARIVKLNAPGTETGIAWSGEGQGGEQGSRCPSSLPRAGWSQPRRRERKGLFGL